MCGIVGYTGHIENQKSVIEAMMDKIVHRGPDSDGSYISDNVTLGFRRLSIIDLAEGSQPIYNEDNSILIVFNGEIYNYQELRDEMIQKGHTFKTHSDTEVLIHMYEEYSYDMLNKLRGMFAFAIYNQNNGELFCARDFFGIKPFYYTEANGHLIFASEIKAILEHPEYHKEFNHDALECYLTFNYSVLEETFFKGIKRLWPGHYLVYKDGQLDIKKYFNITFDQQEMTFDEAVDKVDAAMQDSIKAHKISDVEVGSFLSSGVDSSYVAACSNLDKTFTVGFDYENYSEVKYAEELSEDIGVKNYSKLITPKEYWEAIPTVQKYLDEPLGDASCIALYFVSKIAAEQVKVCLSGEGADEMFGGYPIYLQPLDLKKYEFLPKGLRKGIGKMAKHLPPFRGRNLLINLGNTVEERFIGNIYMFHEDERDKLLKHPAHRYTLKDITGPYYDQVKDKDDFTKMEYLDLHLWLSGDILLKGDKMSMANSLEVRVPFLDKEVWNVARTLPTSVKTGDGVTKRCLRAAAKRHMPERSAKRKKLGFPVPIRVWLKDEQYASVVRKEFTSANAEKLFNTSELVKLIDVHMSGKRDLSKRIWTIYVFLIWYKQYFND